jgi:ribosome-associated heat shock protein Hsp15
MDVKRMEEGKQRIDKWLWAARFFKTRALAAEAVSGGKVHLNGDRVKSARPVKVGDRLNITRPPYEYELFILSLNQQRRPAREARLMYEETEASIQAREALREMNRAMNAAMPFTEKKPSKKDRRQIVRFKRRQGN